MSEPRLIEPLLTDCIMGEPISDHFGVRCCPAMHTQTEDKYIVKILSIPASKKQLAALILSGACKDAADAQRYFKVLADEAVEEAELLHKLSRLEGFRGYDAWQLEPMEDGSGYEVYLRSAYGMTLERHLRRNAMTHLGAVNLGLDLCAALSVCRRNGWLYVDLKPENIYLSDTQGYLIGDLGFIRLSSLKYASLPDKYRSAYTAPEVEDAYSSLNSTLDIYAVGLILYQVYNNGKLPQEDEPMAPPEYADYEMAEIILKACADDPGDRWLDPQEMAQALVNYMQRNTVNDDPIIPPAIPAEPELPEEEPALPEEMEELPEETEELLEEADAIPEEEPELPDEAAAPADEIVELPEEEPQAAEELIQEESAPVEEVEAPVAEECAPVEEVTEAEENSEPSVEEESSSDDQTEEEEEPEQFVIDGFLFDDTLADEDELAQLADMALSDEVSQMLAQADDLIAHKAPDPVVAPEAIDVPMPEPILPETEAPAQEETAEDEAQPETNTEAEAEAEDEAEAEEICIEPAKPRRRKWVPLVILLVLALLLGAGGLYAKQYYETVYLQHVNAITLESAEDWLTVIVDSQIDNSLLTVVCTDTYGNRLTQPVENGRATFTSLPSGMTYKITVTISGRHQLTGTTTSTYTTPNQTSIIGLTGVIGDSDGSMILSFSVQGPDASGWLVKYSSEGEAEQTVVCTGHMAMITGLTPGKTYSFRLVPQDELYVISGDTLEFTAANVAYAEDLTIHGFEGGSLIATWSAREGMTVESWTVRCYNNAGTDLTFTVTEPQISIAGLDIAEGYTLEVTASGMTVSRMASISAGSVTFKDILLDDSVPGQLSISWNYEGTAPAGGWTLVYTANGGTPVSVTCEKNSLVLTDLIPNVHYTIDITLPSGTMYFGTYSTTWDSPAALAFNAYGASADYMVFYLCKAPEYDEWTWEDIAAADFTSDFLLAENAGIVIRLLRTYESSEDMINTTFIIRDANGAAVSITSSAQTWDSMWSRGFCELNLPTLPTAAGTYTLEIYFNGAYATATAISFTVS